MYYSTRNDMLSDTKKCTLVSTNMIGDTKSALST